MVEKEDGERSIFGRETSISLSTFQDGAKANHMRSITHPPLDKNFVYTTSLEVSA